MATESEETFVVPFRLVEPHLDDDEDAEQHKRHRGKFLQKRSIKTYRHATTKWGAALEGFSPLWFAICLSSGGLGIILNSPFPYPARWLATLSSVLYVTDIVLFALFTGLMVARWAIYPHVAVRRAMSDADELGAYAIPPISLMTIAALTASQVSQSGWGGHGFTIVAYVIWWVALLWLLVTVLAVFITMFYTGNQYDRILTPLLFMAPVGLATAGTEAGFITVSGYNMSARLAVPQIIVGYFAVGLAFFMALALYALYLHRLLVAGWPVAAKRPAMFVLVGPCGQISTALQLLGESAASYMRFAQYKPNSGTFWRQQTAEAINGAGILLALLLLGFAYFWFFIAFFAIAGPIFKKRASFTLAWWSVVFPSVTFTTAWLELSRSMDSPAFRVLVSAMTVFIAIAYLVNLLFTIYGVLNGSLLFQKSQAEIEDDMMQQARRKHDGEHKEA